MSVTGFTGKQKQKWVHEVLRVREEEEALRLQVGLLLVPKNEVVN